MGKKDQVTKEYMKDDIRFADAFNYFMYEGRRVIRPENLREQDTTELLNIYGMDEKLISKQDFRDVLKRSVLMQDGKAYYLLLGIENQSEIHYAMPVRNYVYDALNYASQAAEMARRHRKKRDVKGTEFLSGFKKTDRLIPVITLVILWNSGEWDGPRDLHEMMAVQDKEILKFVPNYHLNLIVPEEIKNFERFQSELKGVLKFLAVKDNAKKMDELMKQEWEDYSKMDTDSIMLIETCSGMKIPVNEKEGGETMSLCKGIQGLMDKAAKEATEKQRREMVCSLFEEKVPMEIIARAMGITENEAEILIHGVES